MSIHSPHATLFERRLGQKEGARIKVARLEALDYQRAANLKFVKNMPETSQEETLCSRSILMYCFLMMKLILRCILGFT